MIHKILKTNLITIAKSNSIIFAIIRIETPIVLFPLIKLFPRGVLFRVAAFRPQHISPVHNNDNRKRTFRSCRSLTTTGPPRPPYCTNMHVLAESQTPCWISHFRYNLDAKPPSETHYPTNTCYFAEAERVKLIGGLTFEWPVCNWST